MLDAVNMTCLHVTTCTLEEARAVLTCEAPGTLLVTVTTGQCHCSPRPSDEN